MNGVTRGSAVAGMKSSLRIALFAGAAALSLSAFAATKTWKGNGNASVAANWTPEGAPRNGDAIVFDSTSVNSCTWDIDVKPYSWLQTVDYTGKITFQTEFDEYDGTAAKSVEVDRDVTISGGTWTHADIGKDSCLRRYRLHVKVGGSMTIAAGAKIDVSMLGYSVRYSCVSNTAVTLPNGSNVAGTLASCGGWTTDMTDPALTGILPYGSAIAPNEPGSASGWAVRGGGVVRLDVAGSLTVNGEILSESSYSDAAGSGGSVYVRAGSISGAGRISANSILTKSGSTYSGGAGRVAVVLTGTGSDFSAFDPLEHLTAVCTNTASGDLYVSPGTVYVETPADTANEGWLIIRGASKSPFTSRNLSLCFAASVAGWHGGTVHFSRISLLNGAKALIPEGVTLDLRNTTIEGADGTLSRRGFYLYGGTLIAPDDWNFTDEIVNRGGTIRTPQMTFAATSALTNDVTATNLSFTGNLTVKGKLGSVQCGNRWATGVNAEPVPLIITVASNLTIAAEGVLDVTDRGYPTGKGPTDNTGNLTYGMHGGASPNTAAEPYGSIRNPFEGGTASGGSGTYYGGGIVKLVVGGALTNNGVVMASATQVTYGSGGGSVNVRAGSLAGTGVFNADAGKPKQGDGCGGGRLAVALADAGADFSDFTGTMSAYGGEWSKVGGAGTVWFKTGDQTEDEGTLLVANQSTKSMEKNAKTLVGGAYMAADELAFGDVVIGNKACLVLETNRVMTVSGDFINGGTFEAKGESTVRFVGTDPSAISGTVTFVNVACEVPGKKLAVAGGSTLKITGATDIVGENGGLIEMSSKSGTTWTLDNSSASVILKGVALSNCQATAGLVVQNGADLGGNSANVNFVTVTEAELLTWTGAADTAWDNAANWDGGRMPLGQDFVAIPATAERMPVTSNDLTVASLAVSNGASFNFGSTTLTVNGPVVAAGSLVTTPGAVLRVTGDCELSGSIAAETLSVRLAGTAAQKFTANGQTFAAIEALAPALAFAGSFAADTLTIGDNQTPFAATFAANDRVSVNDFVVKGITSENCSLAGATPGSAWKLAAQLAHVSGVSVSDSDATPGQTVYPSASVANGGGNAGWAFGVTVAHYDGAAWSPSAPAAESVAWIDSGATLDSADAVSLWKLVVDRGATNKCASTFAVSGDVIVGGLLELSLPGTVGGDLTVVAKGTLTHAQNVDAEDCKLDLTVAGDVDVRKDGAIDVTGKGYSGGMGSGPGASQACGSGLDGVSASYGGRGYTGSYSAWGESPCSDYSVACYGSILCPTNCGSCGCLQNGNRSFGGGAIRLTCAGTLNVDGTVAADGGTGYYSHMSSGGSVWLTVASLTGTGTVRANGGLSSDGRFANGGGGRVAVYLAGSGRTFGDFAGSINAFGGTVGSNVRSSAGTVYLQTAAEGFGEGVCRVANVGGTGYRLADDGTDLPGGLYSRPRETRRIRFNVANYGTVSLTADTTVRDITLLDATARLKLNGHTLSIRARQHALSPDDATCIVAAGGAIRWVSSGLVLLVR